MFKKLEGDTALLKQGGVFKPCELYTFQGGIYAKLGGGYVRLRADGTTSKDGVNFDYLEYDGPLFADRFSRLTAENGPKFRPIHICNGQDGHPVLQIAKGDPE